MNKRVLQLITLFILAIQLVGCREDLEFNENYTETPVIYGLLDQSDSIHYVRINRGYLGPGDAFTFAKVPDSNYFESVEAEIQEFLNGQVVRSWTLRDTVLNTKETGGVFFAPEQIVYYFQTDNANEPLNPDAVYRLKVDINEGQLTVSGETKLVDGLAKSSNYSGSQTQMNFAEEVGEYASVLLTHSAGNAVVSNTSMDIVINEHRSSGITQITIPMNIAENTTSDNNFTATIFGETFYQTIANGVTDDPTITRRNLVGLRPTFTGGSAELNSYILVNQPTSSVAQSKPEYTNLSVSQGFQVVGLFSSRQTVSYYRPFVTGNNAFLRCIDRRSTRELCQGAITGNLLFCSQHPGDNGATDPQDFRCQ